MRFYRNLVVQVRVHYCSATKCIFFSSHDHKFCVETSQTDDQFVELGPWMMDREPGTGQKNHQDQAAQVYSAVPSAEHRARYEHQELDPHASTTPEDPALDTASQLSPVRDAHADTADAGRSPSVRTAMQYRRGGDLVQIGITNDTDVVQTTSVAAPSASNHPRARNEQSLTASSTSEPVGLSAAGSVTSGRTDRMQDGRRPVTPTQPYINRGQSTSPNSALVARRSFCRGRGRALRGRRSPSPGGQYGRTYTDLARAEVPDDTP